MENIKKEIETVHFTFESSKKTQDKTIIMEKGEVRKYVLSKYDPREGVKKLIEIDKVNKSTLWIVIGFVLGYVIDEIVRLAGKEANIIVIEPSSEVLSRQLELIEKDRFRNMPNLSIFSGTDFSELSSIYKEHANIATYYNTYLIVNNVYNEFYRNYYNKVIDTIGEIRGELLVNKNTLNERADTILANVVQNRRFIEKNYDITFHKNRYKDIPALIVSAGPSLSKNIQYIKEFTGLIFASGRTLGPILEQGVNPDFVVSIDSEPFTYDTFKGKAENDFPLITIPGGCAKVIESNGGPQYFVDNTLELGKALLNIDLEVMATGGSVATLQFKAAHYMGCNPIVLIGQDLAYTDMKTHSDDCTTWEKKVDADKSKMGAEYMEVDAYHGGRILSQISLVIFLRWFEKYIEENPEVQYINATEGGARIRGTIQMPFKDVCKKYNQIVKPSICHVSQNLVAEDLEKSLMERLSELKIVNELAIKGERLANKLRDEYVLYKGIRKKDILNILKRIQKEVEEKLDRFRDISHLKLMFASIYNEIEMNVKYQQPLQETELEEGLRVSEVSFKLYEALKRASKNMMTIIEDGMKERQDE